MMLVYQRVWGALKFASPVTDPQTLVSTMLFRTGFWWQKSVAPSGDTDLTQLRYSCCVFQFLAGFLRLVMLLNHVKSIDWKPFGLPLKKNKTHVKKME